MIVVAGEALVDRVVDGDGTVQEYLGGSAFNVAVALGRLDTPALLITQTGHDEYGGRIAAQVTGNGAELVAHPGSRTATATARLDPSGVADYAFDIDWSLPSQELPACDALHVGALGTLLEPGRNSVVDLVEQAWARDVTVSFDPNIRAALLGDRDQVWRDVEALAERCRIIKLSDQDVELLLPGAEPADIATTLLSAERTELVVVTAGGAGATAYVDGLAVHVPAQAVEVVDTVGAGDSFVAALLTVLLDDAGFGAYGAGLPTDEDGLRRLLGAANTVAALTCARPGAQSPTRRELPPDWPA